jgi:adenine phosphoribosyltransferase
MRFPQIEKAIKTANATNINNGLMEYKFFEYAFGERGTYISHELIWEIVDGLTTIINQTAGLFEYIVAPEPSGHTWGLLLGHTLKKDVIILRNQTSSHDGKTKIIINGYSKKYLQFHSFNPGAKVIIVDDIISTGETLKNIIENITSSIVAVYSIYSKANKHREIMHQYQIPVYMLVEEVTLDV